MVLPPLKYILPHVSCRCSCSFHSCLACMGAQWRAFYCLCCCSCWFLVCFSSHFVWCCLYSKPMLGTFIFLNLCWGDLSPLAKSFGWNRLSWLCVWGWMSHCKYKSVCVGFLFTDVYRPTRKEEFLEHINSIDPNIQFTTEDAKPDGSISILDTIVMSQPDKSLITSDPPIELWCILLDIKQNIYLHPQLALPDDPNDNICAYYPIMWVSPIIMEGFLIIISSIPPVNKSLKIDLHNVYNLPALHPDLKVQFSFVLKGEYLAISISCTYATLPTSHEIFICLASWCHLWVLNTALYLVDKIEWCMYALFIRNWDLVREQCLVDSHIWHANLALNFNGYIWAINSLASDIV